MIKRAAQFFRLRSEWLGAGGMPVSPEQAQARADVCLKCPYNVELPLYEIFAGNIATTVLRQLQMKSQMQLKVRGEECLHVCDVCLCVLRLKVQTPLKFILENTSTEGLPPHCWQIVEQKQTEGTK